MNTSVRKNRFLRILGLFFGALIPALVILLGVLFLFGGMIFNRAFAVTYLIIPAVLLAVNVKIICSKMRKLSKFILCILLLIPFVVFFFSSVFVGKFETLKSHQGTEALHEYLHISEEYVELPDEAALGNPESVEYHFFLFTQAFYCSENSILLCQYAPDEYLQLKEQLDSVYTFETEPIPAKYPEVFPRAILSGFDIRMLSAPDYPHEMIFIGTNNRTSEILYLHYSDHELFNIESLEDFLLNHCGLRHIL